KEFVFDMLFENTFETIRFFLEACNTAGARAELECFDTGHVANAVPLLDMGLLPRPAEYSLILGVLGGAPPRAATLAHMASIVAEQHPDGDASWQVVGIGRHQWALVDAAIDQGGNVRVGLEDNFYMPSGE